MHFIRYGAMFFLPGTKVKHTLDGNLANKGSVSLGDTWVLDVGDAAVLGEGEPIGTGGLALGLGLRDGSDSGSEEEGSSGDKSRELHVD